MAQYDRTRTKGATAKHLPNRLENTTKIHEWVVATNHHSDDRYLVVVPPTIQGWMDMRILDSKEGRDTTRLMGIALLEIRLVTERMRIRARVHSVPEEVGATGR
jgi:hypothetical protein